jgi:ribulose kinase
LAYQTKHIFDACEEAGHAPVTSIFVTGGLVKNPLYLQAHADVTGCVLELPRESEAVLLGAAVLGARAGGAFGTLQSAMGAMNRVGGRVLPFQLECADECDVSVPSYHACKYAVFRKMADDQLAYRSIMAGAVLD